MENITNVTIVPGPDTHVDPNEYIITADTAYTLSVPLDQTKYEPPVMDIPRSGYLNVAFRACVDESTIASLAEVGSSDPKKQSQVNVGGEGVRVYDRIVFVTPINASAVVRVALIAAYIQSNGGVPNINDITYMVRNEGNPLEIAFPFILIGNGSKKLEVISYDLIF